MDHEFYADGGHAQWCWCNPDSEIIKARRDFLAMELDEEHTCITKDHEGYCYD